MYAFLSVSFLYLWNLHYQFLTNISFTCLIKVQLVYIRNLDVYLLTVFTQSDPQTHFFLRHTAMGLCQAFKHTNHIKNTVKNTKNSGTTDRHSKVLM
jgi:hypothetical protein